MKRFVFIAMPMVLLSILACGCGGDNEGAAGAAAAAGSGGDAGFPPPRPIEWKALPAEGAPSARYLHTAVWTGSKMIIWGGNSAENPSETATGAIYDPASGKWTPTSMQGAPAGRYFHTAVWTGSKMIVWGGFGASALEPNGGIYDPATDTWAPMATAGQPAPRTSHTAIWTGKVMIVWGGTAGTKPFSSGGVYDPEKDSWTALSEMGAATPRFNHSAVWTGTRMIVWGGYNFFDWRNDGASIDLSGGGGGKWVGATAAVPALVPREMHTGVWTGSEMLIWGGWTGGPYDGTGGIFNPAAGGQGAWVPMSMEGAPSARAEHVGVWAGDELVIWGGCGDDTCKTVYGDGGRFTPDSKGGAWTPVAEQGGLSPRRGATAVTDGTRIIVWGGRADSKVRLGDGAESVL